MSIGIDCEFYVTQLSIKSSKIKKSAMLYGLLSWSTAALSVCHLDHHIVSSPLSYG